MNKPILAIVGPSRAGKDTLAQAIIDYAQGEHEGIKEGRCGTPGKLGEESGENVGEMGLMGINVCSYKQKLRQNSCSEVICEKISVFLGVSYEQAWMERHRNALLWKWYANQMRRTDPCFLVRECVRRGADIVVGIRSSVEMNESIRQGLISAVVWVDRPGVSEDPTLEFGYRRDWDYVYNGSPTTDSLTAVAEALYLRHLTKA